MKRKQENVTLSLDEAEKQALGELAAANGFRWGERPNITGLVSALATGKLHVVSESAHPAFALWDRLGVLEQVLGETQQAIDASRHAAEATAAQSWRITRPGADLLIEGPGRLEITIEDFDPERVVVEQIEGVPARSLTYPLEKGTELQLVTLEAGASYLHLGAARWQLPGPIGQQLANVLGA